MLDKLRAVPWESLTHAYGTAIDIPRYITDLTSEDATIRANAREYLGKSIFHQGTRYEATLYAVPFLFELVTSEDIKERHEIIDLLVEIALGFCWEYLPEGFDILRYRIEYNENQLLFPDARILKYHNCAYFYQYSLDYYDKVKEGIPILYELLQHRDIQISNNTVHALAWFPELASESIPRILTLLQTSEDEKVKANAILAIGFLSRNSSVKFADELIRSYFDSDSPLLKVSAAIALARNPLSNEITTLLIESISPDLDFENIPNFSFFHGRILDYICITISKFGTKSTTIPRLCSLLTSLNTYHALYVAEALLNLIVKNHPKSKHNEFDNDELLALHTIAEHDAWNWEVKTWRNLPNLLLNSGIADTKEKLMNILRKAD